MDWAADNHVIGTFGNGFGRGHNAFLVAERAASGADAGVYDETPLGLGKSTDGAGLQRGGDDTMGARLKGAACAFGDQIGNVPVLDLGGVKVTSVKRCEDGDGQDFQVRGAGAFSRRAYHVGVAVNGEKIEIELGDPAHGSFDGGADVEQFHVKEDAFALFFLQFVGERQPAAGQHAKADFVERHRRSEAACELQAFQCVGHIKGDNQAVIGHGRCFGPEVVHRQAWFRRAAPADPVGGRCTPTPPWDILGPMKLTGR